MLYQPPPPFADWPRHLVLAPRGEKEPDRLYLWWSEPKQTLVLCLDCTVIDIPVARAIVWSIDRCVDERRELLESDGANVVVDWRPVKFFPAEARQYLTRRAPDNLAGVRILDSSIAVDLDPVKRMGVGIVAMVISMVTKHKMRVVDGSDLDAELRRHDVSIDLAPPFVIALRSKMRGIDFVRQDPTPI